MANYIKIYDESGIETYYSVIKNKQGCLEILPTGTSKEDPIDGVVESLDTLTNNINTIDKKVSVLDRVHRVFIIITEGNSKNNEPSTLTVTDDVVSPDDGWKIDKPTYGSSGYINTPIYCSHKSTSKSHSLYSGPAILEAKAQFYQRIYSTRLGMDSTDTHKVDIIRYWNNDDKVWGEWKDVLQEKADNPFTHTFPYINIYYHITDKDGAVKYLRSGDNLMDSTIHFNFKNFPPTKTTLGTNLLAGVYPVRACMSTGITVVDKKNTVNSEINDKESFKTLGIAIVSNSVDGNGLFSSITLMLEVGQITGNLSIDEPKLVILYFYPLGTTSDFVYASPVGHYYLQWENNK